LATYVAPAQRWPRQGTTMSSAGSALKDIIDERNRLRADLAAALNDAASWKETAAQEREWAGEARAELAAEREQLTVARAYIVGKEELAIKFMDAQATIAASTEALGLLTTLAPDVEIDLENPVKMALEIHERLRAELAAAQDRARMWENACALAVEKRDRLREALVMARRVVIACAEFVSDDDYETAMHAIDTALAETGGGSGNSGRTGKHWSEED